MGDDSAVRDAWADVGEVFKDIGGRFKEGYHQVAQKASAEGDEAHDSVERSLDTVKVALKETLAAIDDAMSDPGAKAEAKEAGHALLKALGTTLTEVGESLKRTADDAGDTKSPSGS